jgi:hypothetical protein
MTPQQLNTMKLALEALDIAQGMLAVLRSHHQPKMLSAYTAIKEALAQPEQDTESHYKGVIEDVQKLFHNKREAQPEQEPVAWMDKYGEIYKDVPEVLSTDKPLYTSSPQRKPLTDDELSDIWFKQSTDWMEFESTDWMEFDRAIEAKLKETK